ncbi:helix-turn-helix domain-containing protein [Xylanimonas protaetiae]|uniref:DNA-binding protein n=1 Tax=Xylanimonas protaetiae TaxID=2509457 RepID=A0A4P6F5M1_9MICO|nr:helix-turn-helix domain-containing protein [Xylanimonas protaetiae]QAY71260.1 DNA-binding protein [Xylanimonas protaetiae]
MSLTVPPARRSVTTHARQQRHAQEFIARVGGDLRALRLEVPGDAATEVPSDVVAILGQVLEAVADGDTVTVASQPAELTTTQAAARLGISRPTLMGLIGAGDLVARKVGTHHRIATSDVVAFRRARLARQRAAFEELAALDDELEGL